MGSTKLDAPLRSFLLTFGLPGLLNLSDNLSTFLLDFQQTAFSVGKFEKHLVSGVAQGF